MLEDKECLNCGNLFTPRLKSQKFCCYDCRYHFNYNNNLVNLICENCGTEFSRKKDCTKNNGNNSYCSRECELEHKHKEYNEIRFCENCGEQFETKKNSTQRFCSHNCQNEWQKTQVGTLNSHYIECSISCDCCGQEFHTHQYRLDKNENNFCSIECRQKWYAETWSQSDSWKDESRIRTVNMLEAKQFSHTNTEPQIIINDLLDSLEIGYENEYNCKYYSIDNAIIHNDKLYLIEVMGQYWHCDIRMYDNIRYKMQYDRIIRDKAKSTYIINNYNVHILYLWESDIYNNLELCKQLIIKYLDDKISHYNSSDYIIINNNLLLNDNKITQYMYLDNLNSYLSIDLKPKLSKKQDDKWITYNCEMCGKEHEELLCHYKNSKHHYCSYECSNKAQKNSIELICPCCNKDFEMKPSDYKRHKNKDRIFCSSECKKEYYKNNKIIVKTNTTRQ